MTEIFVLNNGGAVFCYYNSDKGINEEGMEAADPNLVASFLTGILQFAAKIHNDEVNSFEMGTKNIIITSTIFSDTDRLYYVMVSDRGAKYNVKKMKIKLDKIRDQFEESFEYNEIINWNGDLSFFESFNHNIKIIIDGDTRILNKEEKRTQFLEIWKEKKKNRMIF
ncbi:MAG: hypothetical protein GY870_13360 [archaeon]|nr:hypothetical protein [archaeon]